jgi:AraC-like DNA-binding protein
MTKHPRTSGQRRSAASTSEVPVVTVSADSATSHTTPLSNIERRREERRQQIAVSTLLVPSERDPVDAAGFGTYTALHRESIQDVIDDLRANRANAAIISVGRVAGQNWASVSSIVRGFAGVPVLGLVLHADDDVLIEGTRALGELGVSNVVDGRRCAGWNRLRASLDAEVILDPARHAAMAAIEAELGEATSGCKRFLLETFESSTGRVNDIATRLSVVPSTLTSRFQRAHLPSPKQYLRYARLVRAAFLGEARGRSCSEIADQLNASSPQSFGRSVRLLMKMSLVQFRYSFKGDAMIRIYLREMITPHREVLRTFDPITANSEQDRPSTLSSLPIT